jgi:hypothetical protein
VPRALSLRDEVALLREQLDHLRAIQDLQRRVGPLDARRTGRLTALRDQLRRDAERTAAPELRDCLREAVALLDQILGPATALAVAA